jgi:uncharacterized protein YecT (DUF1311 family)
MSEILEKIGLVVLGSLLAGAGYLLKRWIERKPVFDAIEKHQKLLSLNKEMRDQRVSLEDLRKLEEDILNKTKAIRQYAIHIKQEITVGDELAGKEFLTQAEMNEHAARSFHRAEEKLDSIIQSLEQDMEKIDLENFRKSQMAWKSFRNQQAEFLSDRYRGGSIQPLIHYSELERLTIERAASLQSEFDERLKLEGQI